MSNPIRQHYIPRSYLKNFATTGKKNKQFVDVYQIENEVILGQVSTKDICVQKNLYTIPSEMIEAKYALEKHYAENVDGEYSKIYNLLIDKSVLEVSPEQKVQVLYVCLSLYFRTPRILNLQKDFNKKIFERAAMLADNDGEVKLTFGEEETISFHINDIDKVRKGYDEKARIKFLIQHLEQWGDFVRFKYDCTINVIEIKDSDAPIITCDNPISIRHFETNQFNGLYDPKAVITMPLDSRRYLEIHPNDLANGQTRINRLIHDKDFAFTTNAVTHQNAMSYLIANKGDIDKHLKIQREYEEDENAEKFVEKAKFKAEQMTLLTAVIENEGLRSKECVSKIKDLLKHPHFQDDEQIIRLKKLLIALRAWE
ncbi:DUF4238 domain-containing protein [Flagellimonas amoyensis]|uniref:DUF4238 domain-containing protein n=1 Tax=Flagellimonas amoyensis TaxID=2169401 RepID=UPI000D3B36D8|nr:DUF4238 domain-containing protein [Allomuricauda amoyensis]